MSFCIIFVCFIMYFIVHAAFMRIKLMMMTVMILSLSLLDCITCTDSKEAACSYCSSTICVCFCLCLDMTMNSVKTAELIDVPFGVWTDLGGLMEPCIWWGPRSPKGGWGRPCDVAIC